MIPYKTTRAALCQMAWLCLVLGFSTPVLSADIDQACQSPVLTKDRFAMDCGDYTLKGTKSDGDAHLETLIVKAPSGKTQTLALNTGESETIYWDSLSEEPLETPDLNFDGHNDLRLRYAGSAGPNSAYAHWLYKSVDGSFARNLDLDNALSGFEIGSDPQAKTISVSARDSASSWAIDTYHWVGERLLPQTQSLSGALFTDSLRDFGDMESVIKTDVLCATVTHYFDDAGQKTKIVLETEGGPCEDEYDHRLHKPLNPSKNGVFKDGNIEDIYENGVLMQRTIFYPMKPIKR